VGHASLMRPDRPLPTHLSVCEPLRRNPNITAAIIAAFVPRWHRASTCWRWRRKESEPCTYPKSVGTDRPFVNVTIVTNCCGVPNYFGGRVRACCVSG
jgi:hypothetical protein